MDDESTFLSISNRAIEILDGLFRVPKTTISFDQYDSEEQLMLFLNDRMSIQRRSRETSKREMPCTRMLGMRMIGSFESREHSRPHSGLPKQPQL